MIRYPEADEFFVDLLFYSRILKCLIAFELKKGKFSPQDTGQFNSYLNVLNVTENWKMKTLQMILFCVRKKNDRTVEYAFQKISNPMGVAVYHLSEQLPEHLKNILPDPESLKKLLG